MRVMKSRKMSWVGCVTCMREIKNAYKPFFSKPEGILGIDGMMILK
jgi:hypothetical protein